ncbi:hypothetical protein ST47_g4741 [Ascochyta rabiei]|uniref:Uncharacterized protein n=1 Tax=Didymella rabiei TaxID=5454 RepID=A0A163F3J7_DIDRA|nr:hypothetical protein ST47_g4741 [Ascochyta rabiei]
MEDIASPSDLLYSSYEEAYDALKTHGMQHGYGFVLKQSWPYHSTVKTRYYYHCDRFRHNYQSSAKLLSTSIRSTRCPFKLVIFRIKHSDQWKLEVQNKDHNHPREDQGTLISATDVHSERKAIREKHLNRRSPVEALLDDLSTTDWIFTVKKGNNNRIQNLFFAHQKQVKLLLANPNVLLIDCTY